MNLNEYQKTAFQTATFDHYYASIAYPMIGIVDEVFELLECDPKDKEKLVRELGDVLWYTSALATGLELPLQVCYDRYSSEMLSDVKGLWRDAGRLCGKVKKILREDDSAEQKMEESIGLLGDIVRRIEGIAVVYGSSLNEVCNMNLGKIFDRQRRGVIQGDGDNR